MLQRVILEPLVRRQFSSLNVARTHYYATFHGVGVLAIQETVSKPRTLLKNRFG